MKEKWIAPTIAQIKQLQRIKQGLYTWRIDFDRLLSLDRDLVYNDDIDELGKEQCHFCIQDLKSSDSFTKGFLDVQEPASDPEGWMVEVLPTPYLLEVLEGLEAGVWWNLRRQERDYQKTLEEWQGHLFSSRIPPHIFEQASRNRDDELKEIRGRLLMFKLSGVQAPNGDWVIRHAS